MGVWIESREKVWRKDWGRLRKVWEKVCKQDCRLEREKARTARRWLTWAFVGRRWEALPQPHVLNAKQHCYCVREQQQPHGLAVALVTSRNTQPYANTHTHIHKSVLLSIIRVTHGLTPQRRKRQKGKERRE